MNFEIYTDRAQGFVQSAQSLALREGHQQFAPRASAEGAARRPGGHGRRADPARRRPPERCPRAPSSAALAKRPKVSGGGAGQLYLAPELARVFDTAEKIAKKAGDKFVTVERLLLALAMETGDEAGRVLKDAGVTPTALNTAINDIRKGRTADSASAEQGYDALEALRPRPDRGRRARASSTPSSAATRRSAAPSRCSRGAPRTTPC